MPSPSNGPYSQLATQPTTTSHSMQTNALLGDTQWAIQLGNQPLVLTYSFAWNSGTAAFDSNYSTLNEPTQGFALTPPQQSAVRTALKTWANVANIQFIEVAESATSVGDLRFAWTHKTHSTTTTAWAYHPDHWWASGGDIWFSSSSMSNATNPAQWLPGGAAFSILLHEIGHSLGLKHPFEGPTLLDTEDDSEQYTVMSYTGHPNGVAGKIDDISHQFHYQWLQPETPMELDIAAIQHLYGANRNFHHENNAYVIGADAPTLRTLWDAGGIDTIDARALTQPMVIDLRPGSFSSLPTLPAPPSWANNFNYGSNNLAIAWSTTIENAIGGAGNDTLIGNHTRNYLEGNAGDDWLNGNEDIDTAIYSGTRSSHSILLLDNGHIQVSNISAGTDTLVSIERVQFDDLKLAFDLNAHAGTAAKIMASTFGAAVLNNHHLIGAAVHLLDQGIPVHRLAQAALTLQLGENYSAAQTIDLLYRNLTQHTYTPKEIISNLEGQITQGSFDEIGLALIVAEMPATSWNIGLPALATYGMAYL